MSNLSETRCAPAGIGVGMRTPNSRGRKPMKEHPLADGCRLPVPPVLVIGVAGYRPSARWRNGALLLHGHALRILPLRDAAVIRAASPEKRFT